MSQAVHNMEGRKCAICGYAFTPASMNLTLKKKLKNGLMEVQRVCGRCFNGHWEKGE
jgi:hypothetical protein